MPHEGRSRRRNSADGSDRQPVATASRPRIELIADEEHPGGTMLVMDDVRQSYVDIDDPTYLDFEYVQYFASVLATLPAGPLAVTHIGGGALTMPRYLQASRPGSPQIVLEPDAELSELVRSRLPLPREHRIRVRPLEGRAGIRALADASADVVVLDAYANGRVPAALTTLEFFLDVSRVLKADGILLANLVDEPGLRYLGRVLAGLRAVFGELQRRPEGPPVRQPGAGRLGRAAGRGRVTPADRPAAVSGRRPRRRAAGRPLRHCQTLDRRGLLGVAGAGPGRLAGPLSPHGRLGTCQIRPISFPCRTSPSCSASRS
ncbi:MAG: fused MFS/spermidine synthase [Jatrophihabitantaceae bacterium]